MAGLARGRASDADVGGGRRCGRGVRRFDPSFAARRRVGVGFALGRVARRAGFGRNSCGDGGAEGAGSVGLASVGVAGFAEYNRCAAYRVGRARIGAG